MAIATLVTYIVTVALATTSIQATDATSTTTMSMGSASTIPVATTSVNGSTSGVNMTTSTTDNTTDTTTIILTSTSITTGLTLQWNTTGLMVAGMGLYSVAANGLNYPFGMALDATASNVYITDQYNNRVQKWAIGGSTGLTVAGQSNAATGSNANELHIPCGIVLDSTGGFYVADSNNYRVQYWSNGASSGTTVAGTGRLMRDTP
ncbi:unnamed protein product [Rotaria sp. Silwood2]|nr:unnamed protein product [Rotaria sp. Silwood2]CAF3022887.1 unnamed protein product [Rotaria sp. Silwood2]CAF3317006.1 unnamed protein product [Rotaria sp. Silwood2]CAF4158749.1 unnamed protein product [Rotaria sp. Silwood2]CAF4264160.1 unnamed protein product [Rotaria sp. Silwood2]